MAESGQYVDKRPFRQRLIEGHLGFRIVAIGSEYAQYQRLDEEGRILQVTPANPRELTMYQLLMTPEKEWS